MMDPLAEKYYNISPYAYVANNPLKYIDPDGKRIWPSGSWDNPRIIKMLFTDKQFRKDYGNAWLKVLSYTDLNDITVLGSALLSPITGKGAVNIDGTPASDEGVYAAEMGLFLPIISGSAAKQAANAVQEGIENVTGFAAKQEGITVLGKHPDYINLAGELGARRFNIPTNIWNKMSAAEQWAANQKFLDRMILRGDKIVLSNRVTDINEVSGAFRKELDYLIDKGYRLSDDGLQMIK